MVYIIIVREGLENPLLTAHNREVLVETVVAVATSLEKPEKFEQCLLWQRGQFEHNRSKDEAKSITYIYL